MKKVFCYGDSNTYGYNPENGLRFPRGVRWTSILQEKLGDKYEVVEQGCNGRTAVFTEPGTVWKSGRYGLEVCLNTYKPVEIIVLMLGTNDLKNFFGATAVEIAAGVEMLVRDMKAFLMEKTSMTPEVLLVSPIETGVGISKSAFGDHFDEDSVIRSKEFPALYEAVAERQGCHFLDAAKVAKPSEVDCLHMTADSHASLADAIYEAIMEMEDKEN